MHAHEHCHGSGAKCRRKHMTCHIGDERREVRLTTPNISPAVASVIHAKTEAFHGMLHKAEELFDGARASAEQAKELAEQWRKERNKQYDENGEMQEKVEALAKEMEERNEKKEEILQVGG